MNLRRALSAGFYAVLDRDDRDLAQLLLRYSRVLQVRLKHAAADELARVARMARGLCDAAGAVLVVNDRVDVALAVGADAVHLGQTDLPLAAARRLTGTRLAIGVSTHDVEQVARAVAGGADYVGFGPIFPTATKVNPAPVQGVEGLRAAADAARGTPLVAIGGIGPGQAAEVYAAGATAICAIGAVNGAVDVAAAARALGRTSPWPSVSGRYTILRKHDALLHDE